MVKGVSKSVIEISDTGNKYFSKIILYVSPEFSSASDKKLKKEASSFIERFELTGRLAPLRKTVKKQKIKSMLIITASVLFTAVLCAVILAVL